MVITPQNILKHELIGLEVKIDRSTDQAQKGLKGKVIDESYNTLKIESGGGKEKIIPKRNSIYIFTLPNGTKVSVDGKLLIGRPEDRIKKKIARW